MDKKPFKLDPIHQEVVFHATTCLEKGRGAKVIVPTFTTQSPVRLEILYKLDREVGYYRAHKGKGNRKITSPQQDGPEEEPTQAPLEQEVENVQGSENVEATQTQDNPQVHH